jgi:protein-S-isoprenylcysteine O-methyltransferase Ste14
MFLCTADMVVMAATAAMGIMKPQPLLALTSLANWRILKMNSATSYGLWPVVLVYSLLFLAFTYSFFRPRTKRDWRTFGAFSAFIVALFAEMYGFPLTIYLAFGWLGNRFPGVDFLSHNSGHLLQTLLGWQGNAHFGPLHLISNVLILAGFLLLAAAWKVLYVAQRNREVAVTGPYSRIRHPQYVGFIVIMVGFLIQWPTFATMLMFPVLVYMYVRLARREEQEALAEFGEEYARYTKNIPRFLPRIGQSSDSSGHLGPPEAQGGSQ